MTCSCGTHSQNNCIIVRHDRTEEFSFVDILSVVDPATTCSLASQRRAILWLKLISKLKNFVSAVVGLSVGLLDRAVCSKFEIHDMTW